jgi:hypothetical protein
MPLLLKRIIRTAEVGLALGILGIRARIQFEIELAVKLSEE